MTWLLLLLAFSVCATGPAQAAPRVKLELVTAASSPMYVTHAGDSRLFIVERVGRIRVFKAGDGLLPTPFLDISGLVDTQNQGGLFTIAFHPDFATNGLFFVSYTSDGPGDPDIPLTSVIARYEVSADPDLADPLSGRVLLTWDQPFGDHNNGQIAFGPHDGLLYVGSGDGGATGDPACRAQSDGFHGKLLRVDVDQNTNQEPFYGIPAGNPYADPNDGVPDELWARGFRNPWRFSFDRATGDLYVGDVGQDAREEVDLHLASSGGGQNYGWKIMEGTSCHDPDPIDPDCPVGTPSCFDPSYTAPIFEYDTGDDCAVTGGFVYRGSAIPGLQGLYVFGDVCSALIWALEETSPGSWVRSLLADGSFAPGIFPLTSFGEDAAGELYVMLLNEVYRLEPDASPVPVLGLTGRAVFILGLLGAWTLQRRRPRRRGGAGRASRRWAGGLP